MGDRIAVLRQGGTLAQYGTADELLSHPADDFVADFVGADRGLKRLSLRTVRELVDHDPNMQVPPGTPTVPARTTLRTGLSVLLAAGADVLVVTDEPGERLGTVTLDRLREVAGARRTEERP
jgi:osmoprotectant transport system ATP-binding protein